MWPDRASNPGQLGLESDALPTALVLHRSADYILPGPLGSLVVLSYMNYKILSVAISVSLGEVTTTLDHWLIRSHFERKRF